MLTDSMRTIDDEIDTTQSYSNYDDEARRVLAWLKMKTGNRAADTDMLKNKTNKFNACMKKYNYKEGQMGYFAPYFFLARCSSYK